MFAAEGNTADDQSQDNQIAHGSYGAEWRVLSGVVELGLHRPQLVSRGSISNPPALRAPIVCCCGTGRNDNIRFCVTPTRRFV